jgi:hypothetical protein
MPHTAEVPASPPAAESPPRPGRVRETLVLAASVVGVFGFGWVVLAIAFGATAESAGPVVAELWSAKLLAWLVLLVAVQFGLRDAATARRQSLIVLAAPVAFVVEVLVTNGPYLMSMGSAIALWGMQWLIGAAAFTICVGLGVVLARRLLAGTGRFTVLIATLCTIAAGALAIGLVAQFLDVYFAIWTPAPPPTSADGERYAWTAGAMVVLAAAGVAAAALSRVRALLITTVVVAGLGVAIALLFQVPQGRFVPREAPAPAVDDDYVPCFGEGDPNCVGG